MKELDSEVNHWTGTELKESLIEILANSRRPPTNIFIDALDEGTEDDVRQMVDFVDKLAIHGLSSGAKLRICLSSRHYPNITIRRGLSVILEDQAEHSKDIEVYTTSTLHGDPEDAQMSALMREVCKKSAGVFLWVVLVIPLLNTTYDRGGDMTALRKLLKSLPTELDALFADILAKSDEDSEECASLLQWVLFSEQPLTPVELFVAIKLNPATRSMEHVEIPKSSRLETYLLHCSRGMIELTNHEPQVVQFIHETVRTFLLSSNASPQLDPSLETNVEGLSHEKIKTTCLSCVQQKPRRRSSAGLLYGHEAEIRRAPSTSLLKYAVVHLMSHANAARKHGIPQSVFLTHMQKNKRGDLATWCPLHNVFKRDYFRNYSTEVPLLIILVEQNLPYLVQSLCNDLHADVNALGGQHGSALHAAGAEGNESIVGMLLASGATINKPELNYGHTALSLACILSRYETVQLLLNQGADVNAKAGDHGSALQAACRQPNIQIVRRLLTVKADINGVGGDFGSALEAASLFGHEVTVKLLIEAGADVNLIGGEYHSALQAASFSGHSKIMQMLLEGGADVNISSKEIGSALHAACSGGHGSVTMLLLKNDADVNAQGGQCGSALQAASFQGHTDIVKLLLAAKANVNYQGGEFGTALQAAASRGHEELVKIFLKAGADVHTEGGLYGSALHGAAAGGNANIATLLLQAGGCVDRFCEPYGTALQVAAYHGHARVVEVLLSAGADPRLSKEKYGSALEAARVCRHDEVVYVLGCPIA